MPNPPELNDESDLAGFGYAQSLGRSLGGFSSFAAGFAYISILTGLFQMFPMGYRAAGPGFFWTWPVVALGQICVALGFAELSAHFPLCGSVYQWGKQVGSGWLGWLAGWVSLAGSIAALAAVAMALQSVLPIISPAFQLIGSAADPADSAKNAVILGSGLIVLTTILNARGVALMARINNIGVLAEILGAVLLVALLFVKARHGPGVVFGRGISPSGKVLGPGAFLAAALTASYVLYGFETAGSLAEETVSPRKKSPRAILHAIVSASILGGLLILSGMMAAPDPNDPTLGLPDGGLASIVTRALGPAIGTILLASVAIAIGSCTLAVQTGAVRLVFAMARDGLLPGARALATVDRTSRTPIGPAVAVGFLAVAVLLLNLNYPRVVEAIGSVSVVWINLAYWLVSFPLLVYRLKGWPGADTTDTDGTRLFSLGRFGLPVNVLAVVWGFVIVINTGWPRAEIYGAEFPQRFLAPLGTIALLAVGGLYYNTARRGVAAGGATPARRGDNG
ncbi:MAG: puuP [Planctomycetota bacterium]|nr:puuP [Planctomycetota bacterium]